MYKEKKEKQQQILERNIIGSNTSIVGDVISEGDFRIDGKVEGTIKTGGRVVIGKSGTAIGKIECSDADIEGKFSGELQVNNLLTLSLLQKSQEMLSLENYQLNLEPNLMLHAL